MPLPDGWTAKSEARRLRLECSMSRADSVGMLVSMAIEIGTHRMGVCVCSIMAMPMHVQSKEIVYLKWCFWLHYRTRWRGANDLCATRNTHTQHNCIHMYTGRSDLDEGKKITLKLIIEGKCLIKCSSTRLPFWNCIKKDSGCCWWFCCWCRCCCCSIWCWCCFVRCRPICTAAEQCRYASVGRAKDLFADRNSEVTRTEITR